VHRYLPVAGLRGIACHDAHVESMLKAQLATRNLAALKVAKMPDWYF
jgi:hypothetical protein